MYGTATGNGIVDDDDGLKTTCVAITDAKNNTVLLISIDTLGAFGNLTNDVRNQILKSIKNNPSDWENVSLFADAIVINGSHTHSSLRFSDTSIYGSYDVSYKTDDKNYEAKQYYKRVVDQIVAAAKEACQDRAEATMYKSTVDVSDALDVDGVATYVDNLQLNFVRQYNTYYRVEFKGDTKAKIDAKELVIADEDMSFNVIQGSNFGWPEGVRNYVADKYNIPRADVKVLDRRGSPTIWEEMDMRELVSVNGEEAPADDKLHLIEFRFAENSGKKPIAMINWRAHTTENGGDYFGAASSDYVGPLRAILGKRGYRVAFFLGAAGNLVINSRNSQGMFLTPWREFLKESGWKSDVHLYADLLTRAALTKLDGNGTKMDAGDIKVTTSNIYAPKQNYSDGWIKAVDALIKEAGNDEAVWKYNNKNLYPYRYEDYNGEVYIIASYFHANTINSRRNATPDDQQGASLSAIALGDAAAFVTAPYEISDRYYDDIANGDLLDNDWNDLAGIIGDGDPFVLSCTNGYGGYLPGSLEYIYNTEEFYEIYSQNNAVEDCRRYGEDGPKIYGPGNYESHISPFARGAGEKMVDHFETMLNSLKNDTYAKPTYCELCDEYVIWQPVSNTDVGSFESGHYYLTEDISAQKGATQVADVGCTIHLELNGFDYEVNGTAFHPYNYATITVTDKVGGGNVVSHGVNKTYGAAAIVSTNATLNWYGSGTFSCVAEPTADSPAARTIYAYGTVNVYDGTIHGGKVIEVQTSPEKYDNGCGATVYLGSAGKLNVYGGSVTAGDAVKGDCVYLSATGSKVQLSGNASVDEIYIKTYNDNHSQLTVNGGTANLTFASDLYKDKVIGTGTNGYGLSVNNGKYSVKTENGKLKLDSYRPDEKVAIGEQEYRNIYAALAVYKQGDVIALLSNVTAPVTLAQDTYIDLKGSDITGKVTVPEGKTLYCKDSATDDYDIDDDVYGQITNYSGDIQPVRAGKNDTDKDYLKVTEGNAISFHRVNLTLTHVTLTPERASIKYKSAFEGDRLVAENVKQFGIAFNLSEIPNATNMAEGTYSKFDNFVPGENANGTSASTSVVDIMKTTQTEYINGMNAKMPIYGSAYILTNDGEYLFGKAAEKTFRQVVQDVDTHWDRWEDEQKAAVVEMYKRFEGNMQYWGLSNIQQAAAK